jgi:DNA-binding CsgD family transcriptional regulator/tetratricopeptide (TPR) repeat protein
MATASGLPPVRGREAQLALIAQRLHELRAGAGSVIVIEGAPGFGKTRLLQEAFSDALSMGIRGGHGMADPFDSVVDLAPLLEALFDNDPPLLDRSTLRDTHAAPEQRFWLLHDLEALLEQAVMDGPLLVCLDDLHWADNGTAAAVRSLPKRLTSLPIAWFLATRPGQGSVQVRDALAQVVEAGADTLRLDPLREDAVAQVVADLLAAEPDVDVLRSADRTQGNPFLLVELVRGLEEEQIVTVESGRARLVADRLPSRVSDNMRRRLSRLPETAEHVAVTASSLGRRFTVADLAAMSELSVPQLLPAVRTLVDAAILTDYDDRLMFGHDLVRDAVRASVPGTVRRALDRRGADVLLARGALPVEVATQLARSAEPGDDVAINTLADAAEALSATDPGAAAELAEHALRLAPAGHPRRGPLVARRAISLFAAGRGAQAKQFADTALRQALPVEHEAQVRLSIASMFALSPDLRLDNAQQALALPDLSTDLRAWLEALAFHNTVVAVRTDAAADMAEPVRKVVEHSTSVEARFALELAQGGLDYQQFRFDSALERLDHATRIGTSENVRARLAHYFRSWPLAALDRFDDAQAVAVAGLADAQRDRQNWALHIFETWKGLQALQAGRLSDAAVCLGGRFSPEDAHLVVGIIDAANVAGLGQVKIHLGDERGAREIALICNVMLNATAPGIQQHAAWYLASHAMAQGDPRGAHQRLCALGADQRLALFPLFPHDVCNDPQLLRIALAAGDDELVEHLLARSQQRRDLNPAVLSIQASAAHLRGLAHHSAADLERATHQLEEAGRPLALASALEDLGRQRLSDGRTADAIEAFNRALVLDTQVGATWDAARVRRRLRRLGIRRRIVAADTPRTGWAALTSTEIAVAELATEGRTNRQIAEHLFVSPYTVDTHLRHIFDKLGVKSRVELTRVAADRHRLTD